MKRWIATVSYHTASGEPLTVTHDFDELEDLHDLIERGPNFYAIEEIVVRINAGDIAMTLEASPVEHLGLGAIFTAVSLARSYVLRRVFRRIGHG